MPIILQIALGGAAGAVLRYAVVQQTGRLLGLGFPFGTTVVNVLGSFAMGLAVAWLAGRSAVAPLLMAGFLGGFTTFSAFSLDAVALVERGQTLAAAAYVLVSVLGSIAALFLGLTLARGWLS